MSDKFREIGSGLYIGAGGREHDEGSPSGARK